MRTTGLLSPPIQFKTLLTKWEYEDDASPERKDCGTTRLAATIRFRTAGFNTLSNGIASLFRIACVECDYASVHWDALAPDVRTSSHYFFRVLLGIISPRGPAGAGV